MLEQGNYLVASITGIGNDSTLIKGNYSDKLFVLEPTANRLLLAGVG